MKWLRKKIRIWLNEEVNDLSCEPIKVRADNTVSQSGMSFSLYKAVGGHILETRNYNPKTDRHEGTLYMIHEDDDFAKQVAQAIMLESIKQ